MSNEDLIDDDYEGPGSADAIKLEGEGDQFRFIVTEVGDVFEGDYGPVFVVTGRLVAKKGDTLVAPEVGEEGGFLLAYTKTVKGVEKIPHVREEWIKATKAAGRRDGSIHVGDDVAVLRKEDVLKGKDNKAFKNPFKKHVVKVFGLADNALITDGDTPF
jgi:hypothetical protein